MFHAGQISISKNSSNKKAAPPVISGGAACSHYLAISPIPSATPSHKSLLTV
jgi:hypothetical protein